MSSEDNGDTKKSGQAGTLYLPGAQQQARPNIIPFSSTLITEHHSPPTDLGDITALLYRKGSKAAVPHGAKLVIVSLN